MGYWYVPALRPGEKVHFQLREDRMGVMNQTVLGPDTKKTGWRQFGDFAEGELLLSPTRSMLGIKIGPKVFWLPEDCSGSLRGTFASTNPPPTKWYRVPTRVTLTSSTDAPAERG